MRDAKASRKRLWIKALALCVLSSLFTIVIGTGCSRDARRSPPVVSNAGAETIALARPRAEETRASLVGRLDEDARGGRAVVDVLPRDPYGDLYLAQLRRLLGAHDAAPVAPDRMLQVARALRHARIERDGRFRCTGLAPGDYLVVAFVVERASNTNGADALIVRTARSHVATHSAGRTIDVGRFSPLN